MLIDWLIDWLIDRSIDRSFNGWLTNLLNRRSRFSSGPKAGFLGWSSCYDRATTRSDAAPPGPCCNVGTTCPQLQNSAAWGEDPPGLPGDRPAKPLSYHNHGDTVSHQPYQIIYHITRLPLYHIILFSYHTLTHLVVPSHHADHIISLNNMLIISYRSIIPCLLNHSVVHGYILSLYRIMLISYHIIP